MSFTALQIEVGQGGTQADPTVVSFNENIPSGTVLGTIRNLDQRLTYSWAVQGGVTQNANGRYTFVERIENGKKVIDIVIAPNMGGEVNFDYEAASFHEIVLAGSDAAGNTAEGSFQIQLVNINEAPTSLTLTNASNPTFTFMENTPVGTVIGVLGSTDGDKSSQFGTTGHRYSLSADNPAYILNAFEVVLNTATRKYEVKVKQGAVIDWDNLPAGAKYYDIKLVVTDLQGAANGLSLTQTFRINLTNDTGDDPVSNPVPTNVRFSDNGETAITINENTTAVGTVTATDTDTLTYSLATDNNPNANLFTISSTGVLTLKAGVDYEALGTNKYYDIAVMVSDGTNPPVRQVLRVNIENVNEKPTNIRFQSTGEEAITINENTTTVGTLIATDPENGSLSYSFATSNNPHAGLFNLSSSGVLSLKNGVDYETMGTNKFYDIVIVVSDGTNTDTRMVRINIADVAENGAPTNVRFSDNGETAITINENTTAVGTVTATDTDTLTYSLATDNNPNANLFTISSTGVLTLKAGVDYEALGTNKYYDIAVMVSDGTNPPVRQVLRVNIENVNEAPGTPSYTSGGIINETVENGTSVGTLSATDPDGTKPSFVFDDTGSTTSADGAFQIVEINNVWTVVVKDKAAIQAQSGASRTFTYDVRATDGSLVSDSVRKISITVNDVTPGNNAPVIEGASTPITKTVSDRNNIQAFSAIEIRDDGQLKVVVKMDVATKGRFVGNPEWYNAQEGTYTIFGTAAQVTTALQALQFDARDKVAGAAAEVTNFTITVTDNGGVGLVTTNSNISVSATAPIPQVQNQAPKDITFLNGGAIQELAQNGSLVATLGATDPDDTANFAYSIINPDGRFAIVGNQIVVANGVMLDAEQATAHTLRVRVTDKNGLGLSYEEDITINVTDVAQEVMTSATASPFNDIIKGSKTGNFKDVFYGGAGDDKLWGGYGNDTLWGGTGKDVFVFDGKLGTSKTDRKVNFDKIQDYSVKDDSIWLDNALFIKNKTLYKAIKKGTENKPLKLAKKFFSLDKAKDKDDYFIYDTKKRVLVYDADGSGSKEGIEIATFTKNKALTKFTYAELLFI